VNISIFQGIDSKVLATIISCDRLLTIGESKRAGLILCKAHYAEFAGPGAAIASPVEQGYTSIIAIGDPEILEVTTSEDRQRAYGRRIQWVRWLQKIVFHSDPIQRAEKLFSGFEEFFGGEVVSRLPDESLALLAGVLPHTISGLRSQNRRFGLGQDGFSAMAPIGAALPVDILDGKLAQPPKLRPHSHFERSTQSGLSLQRRSLPQSA
jgi:hypothetical protein